MEMDAPGHSQGCKFPSLFFHYLQHVSAMLNLQWFSCLSIHWNEVSTQTRSVTDGI